MNRSVYSKPELVKYGDISEITKATGGNGADVVIVGTVVDTPDGPIGVGIGVVTPGSGVSINIL